ncbi:MAG: tRNA pseudouridine(38-40) synthase TruA [Candidatus Omnitrophota bacterium]
MRNILLKIEYDGTNYQGWQTQRKRGKTRFVTIQETIEKVLSQVLQENVNLISSGRTDSGVHAKEQVANFNTYSEIPLKKIKIALNSLLPEDIRIKAICLAGKDFHARYCAKSKTYRYAIINREYNSVFDRSWVVQISRKLDIKAMQEEAKTLIGRHDFKSFQASDKIHRNSIRTIKKLLVRKRNNYILIDVEADGFLYNMVRNIVGTLLEVGKGKFEKGAVKRILKSKDRSQAGPTAPAKGLCLLKVNY